MRQRFGHVGGHWECDRRIRRAICALGTVTALVVPLTSVGLIGSVGGPAGASGAAKKYTSTSCALSGHMKFAPPGLSFTGSLGTKSIVTSDSSVVPGSILSGSGGCGSTPIMTKIKIPAADCRKSQIPICRPPTGKRHFAYGVASSLFDVDLVALMTSLSHGIAMSDNGNAVLGAVTLTGTSPIPFGGSCGPAVGMSLAGRTNVAGLTYRLLLCFVRDHGTGTTGGFFTDWTAAINGDSAITITAGSYGGVSSLTFVKV